MRFAACAFPFLYFWIRHWAVTVGLDDYACIGYNIATIQSVLTVLSAHRVCVL